MNKKGFTLIELLAVIVILAIIALITAPIILGVIENARKDAAKDKAWGTINSVRIAYTQDQVKDSTYTLGTPVSFSNKNPYVGSAQVKASGELPTSGTVTINEDGSITAKNLKFGKYICSTIKSETDKTIDPNNMVCVKGDVTSETYDGTIYAWNTNKITLGTSKIANLQSTKTAEPYYESAGEVMSASGYTFFNKYTVVDDVITEGYACQTFGVLSEPVCVQGYEDSNGNTFYNYESTPGNWAILNELKNNQTFTGSCRINSSTSDCLIGFLGLAANSNGGIDASMVVRIVVLVLMVLQVVLRLRNNPTI